MTTFSTIFGIVPLALSQADASEIRTPMGYLVIGRMLSSTLLTLLAVPVVYALADDAVGFLRRIYSFLLRKGDVHEAVGFDR